MAKYIKNSNYFLHLCQKQNGGKIIQSLVFPIRFLSFCQYYFNQTIAFHFYRMQRKHVENKMIPHSYSFSVHYKTFNLKSHAICQLQCPGCKARYIGKTDRCLILLLDKQGITYHNSAMHYHVQNCEQFRHFVELHNLHNAINNKRSHHLTITSTMLYYAMLQFSRPTVISISSVS